MRFNHWTSCYDVFFFQAEDGIRDATVTGVQTCALPILGQLFEARPQLAELVQMRGELFDVRLRRGHRRRCRVRGDQIGRASCRARLWASGDDVDGTDKKSLGKCSCRVQQTYKESVSAFC